MGSHLSESVQVLELFAGIGERHAHSMELPPSWPGSISNQQAKLVYELNFDHPYFVKSIEDFSYKQVCDFGANCWWVSAPCQPHTRRGNQLDATDPRSNGLKQLIEWIPQIGPECFLLENVCGFANSVMRSLLFNELNRLDYQLCEVELCPTQFGIPNQRPRYYLVAVRSQSAESKQRLFSIASLANYEVNERQQLHPFLELHEKQDWDLPPTEVNRYVAGMNVVSRDAYESNCFTAAYGKSMTKCGSYLASDRSRSGIRRFRPNEIARLLGFWGESCEHPFQFPRSLSDRQQWKLLGNSISVVVVRKILERLFPTKPATLSS